MHPLYVSELYRARQEELIAEAESWRLSHPSGTRLRYRTGARLVAFGLRLMGER